MRHVKVSWSEISKAPYGMCDGLYSKYLENISLGKNIGEKISSLFPDKAS